MGFYDKQIQYLDLWEYGERIGNVGFVKIDVREEECKVWVSVKGIYQPDVQVARLMLLDEEEEYLADQMLIHQGMGNYAAKWETENLAHTDLGYSKWEGIRIVLSEYRYIEKRWKTKQEEPLYIEPAKEEAEKKEEVPLPPPVAGPEDKRQAVKKWDMLGHYYKKKKPFEDEKEYISISPEDLILLPEKYEHLYKNSFLLHGYYAYGHLLIGAVDVQGRNIYRLYVPGLGHDKEQVVANMFGFGNFMPLKGSQSGMNGYYYMTVEL